MEIIIPVLSLGSLGLLFGLGLAITAKRFCVKADPRVDEILSKLPGANCGVCGQPGCMGFAEGLIKGSCSIESCKVMEEPIRKEVADLLGIKLKPRTKIVANLHCKGGQRVRDRFQYLGIKDCFAADLVLGGQKSCVYGCLGFGDCERVCAFGAIKMGSEGLPVIDEAKCTGCGRCVEVCPKKLFSLVPETNNVYVACSSRDLGKDTKAVCPVGCIACRKCEQACPVDAIHVLDDLAVIDYNKCTSCGECVKVCPMKTIQTRITADVKSADIRG